MDVEIIPQEQVTETRTSLVEVVVEKKEKRFVDPFPRIRLASKWKLTDSGSFIISRPSVKASSLPPASLPPASPRSEAEGQPVASPRSEAETQPLFQSEAETQPLLKTCPICLDEVNSRDEETELPVCPMEMYHDPKEMCHKECLMQYVNSVMNGMYPGTCPPLYCPQSHVCRKQKKSITTTTKLRPILLYDNLLEVHKGMEKYINAANQLLSIKCGNCHKMGNFGCIPVAKDMKHKKLNVKQFLRLESTAEFNKDFMRPTALYSAGLLSIEEYYQYLTKKLFPPGYMTMEELNAFAYKRMEDCSAWIFNVERRNNLMLRFLRDYPRFQTACCKRVHCFRCKSASDHKDTSCDDNLAGITRRAHHGEILNCPGCSVQLVRSDGCSKMTCVCGREFDWEREVLQQIKLMEFRAMFPEDPNQGCVDIFFRCIHASFEEDMNHQRSSEPELERIYEMAQNWYKLNQTTIDSMLVQELRRRHHPMCINRICYIEYYRKIYQFPYSKTVGYRKALSLWCDSHHKEMLRCESQSRVAIKSILSTFCPTEKDKLQMSYGFNKWKVPIYFERISLFRYSCIVKGEAKPQSVIVKIVTEMNEYLELRKKETLIDILEEFCGEVNERNTVFFWMSPFVKKYVFRMVITNRLPPLSSEEEPTDNKDEKQKTDDSPSRGNCGLALKHEGDRKIIMSFISNKNFEMMTNLLTFQSLEHNDMFRVVAPQLVLYDEFPDSLQKRLNTVRAILPRDDDSSRLGSPLQKMMDIWSLVEDEKIQVEEEMQEENRVVSLSAEEKIKLCFKNLPNVRQLLRLVGGAVDKEEKLLLMEEEVELICSFTWKDFLSFLVDYTTLLYSNVYLVAKHISHLLEMEHKENAVFVAATHGVSNQSMYKAMCFIYFHVQEINEWYAYNESCQEPLVRFSEGCACVPRHTKGCNFKNKTSSSS